MLSSHISAFDLDKAFGLLSGVPFLAKALISEDNWLPKQPIIPLSNIPQPGYTHRTEPSPLHFHLPIRFHVQVATPTKGLSLQSWCPYNSLSPDATLVGRNLCSNPLRATRWIVQTIMQDCHGTKRVPATLPYGKAKIYRNVCLSYSVCKSIL